MTHVHVHHADPIGDLKPTPQGILIDTALPKFGDDYAERSQALFADDAKALADALQAQLPGGTLNALLAEMLSRQACLLRVPMPVAAIVQERYRIRDLVTAGVRNDEIHKRSAMPLLEAAGFTPDEAREIVYAAEEES